MKNKHKFSVFLFVVLIGTTFFSVANADPPSPPPRKNIEMPTDVDPVLTDTRQYAKLNQISLIDAQERLKLQSEIGRLDAQLASKEMNIFGGLWIQHQPDFKVIIHLTKGNIENIKPYLESNRLEKFIQIKLVKLSTVALQEKQMKTLTLLSTLKTKADTNIDLIKNRVIVYITNISTFRATLQEANVQLDTDIDLQEVPTLATTAALEIMAGLYVWFNDPSQIPCTTGFTVKDPWTRFVTTAGHCPDKWYSNGIPYDVYVWSGTDWGQTPFIGQANYGSYDFQIHLKPNTFWTLSNKAFMGSSGTRSVTTAIGRDTQSVGWFTCKFGQTTNYTCGTITSKSFQPAGLSATFIRVGGDYGINMSAPGDSGGPWMYGQDAYGMMTHWAWNSSRNANDGIYMAVNYLNDHGLSVLTTP